MIEKRRDKKIVFYITERANEKMEDMFTNIPIVSVNHNLYMLGS